MTGRPVVGSRQCRRSSATITVVVVVQNSLVPTSTPSATTRSLAMMGQRSLAAMTRPLEEPAEGLSDPRALLLDYLDYFRATVARQVGGLGVDELRSSRLPSGWTVLEMLKHLVSMERRWLQWGFRAERVDEPWGNADPRTNRWRVGADETVEQLLYDLEEVGRRTRKIVEATNLGQRGAVGGRFGDEDDPPTLAWILFHVLQEYARHAGHLDIARELADGRTGPY